MLRAAADDVLPQSRNALVSACELQDVAVVVSGFGVPDDMDTRWPLASVKCCCPIKRGEGPEDLQVGWKNLQVGGIKGSRIVV